MILSSLVLSLVPAALPQEDEGFPGLTAGNKPRVEIPWNRYYDYDEILAHLDRIEAEFPELVSHEVIGTSVQGRELRVYAVTNQATGRADEKPVMWVDGNIHGNEV